MHLHVHNQILYDKDTDIHVHVVIFAYDSLAFMVMIFDIIYKTDNEN